MKTSQEIRLENLRALVAEAGSAAALARLSEVPPPYISQLINGVKNDGGETRKMGDDTARKLERGMHKAKGWIDADHATEGMPGDDLEKEVVKLFQSLNPERKAAVLDSIRGIFNGQQEAKKSQPPKRGVSDLANMGKNLPAHIPGEETTKHAGKKRGRDAL